MYILIVIYSGDQLLYNNSIDSIEYRPSTEVHLNKIIRTLNQRLVPFFNFDSGSELY